MYVYVSLKMRVLQNITYLQMTQEEYNAGLFLMHLVDHDHSPTRRREYGIVLLSRSSGEYGPSIGGFLQLLRTY
jgi:hypothetical protein